jgi:hypothetical protein
MYGPVREHVLLLSQDEGRDQEECLDGHAHHRSSGPLHQPTLKREDATCPTRSSDELIGNWKPSVIQSALRGHPSIPPEHRHSSPRCHTPDLNSGGRRCSSRPDSSSFSSSFSSTSPHPSSPSSPGSHRPRFWSPLHSDQHVASCHRGHCSRVPSSASSGEPHSSASNWSSTVEGPRSETNMTT